MANPYNTYQSLEETRGRRLRNDSVANDNALHIDRQKALRIDNDTRGIQNEQAQRGLAEYDKKLKTTNLAMESYEVLRSDPKQRAELVQGLIQNSENAEYWKTAWSKNPKEAKRALETNVQRWQMMGGELPQAAKEDISPELRRYREGQRDPGFAASQAPEAKDTRSPQRKLYDETQADPAFAASQEKGPSESQSDKQEEIAAMMALGVSEEVATKGAYNKYTITNHPTTGKISIVDETNGQVRDADSLTLRAIVDSLPQDDSLREGPSLDLYSDIDGTVTGFAPELKQALQSTAGQIFGVEFLPPEIQEKRQLFVMQQKNLVRALMQSPRFLATEREAIEKEIDIAPKAWTDAQTLRSKFKAIDKSLRNRLMNERNKARNPSTSSDDVADAIQKGSIIEDFLRNMAVPQEAGEDQSAEDEALINKYL